MKEHRENIEALARMHPRLAQLLARYPTREAVAIERAHAFEDRSFARWRDPVIEASRTDNPSPELLDRLHTSFDCPLVGLYADLDKDPEFRDALGLLVERKLVLRWDVGTGGIYGDSRVHGRTP